MSTSLAHTLGSAKPRETSGSRTSNRFDFQKDWAICELLRLHLNENEYLLILDYHEDVVVLNSESEPDSVKFYQLKSLKSGDWSVASLCNDTSKGNSGSILKKLYSNYLLCPEETASLVFVSNQGIKAKLKNKANPSDYDSVSFDLFVDADKEKIHVSIEGSDAESCNIHGLKLISIDRTDLPVCNHDVFAKGKLVDFFSVLAPKKKVSINIAYKTLFDEIKRKNNVEILCSDFCELKTTKGIGREEFGKMANAFISYTSNSDYWNEASASLLSEGYDFATIRKIKAAWNKYTVEVMNSFDSDLSSARKVIISDINKYEQVHSTFKLKQLIADIKQNIDFSKIPTLRNEPYIEEASIIYEVMVSEPIQKANSELEEEAV